MRAFGLKKWALLAIAALCAVPAVADTTPKDKEKEKAPQWVAFFGYRGGFTPPQYHALNQAPNILVRSDGLLMFRDDRAKNEGTGVNADIWRQATLSKDAVKQFIEKARATNFLTVEKEAPVPAKPDENGMVIGRPMISDAATTFLGLNLDGKHRVVSEYALDFYAKEDKDDKYLQSLWEFQKLIEGLRPKESKRYEPEAISVMFFQNLAPIIDDHRYPVWPLPDTPALDGKGYRYTGDDMKAVLQVLGESATIAVGDKLLSPVWAPAFDLPEPGPNKPIPTTEPAGVR